MLYVLARSVVRKTEAILRAIFSGIYPILTVKVTGQKEGFSRGFLSAEMPIKVGTLTGQNP